MDDNPTIWRTFDIAQNTTDSIHMFFSRCLYELRENMHCIAQIRTSNGKINGSPYELTITPRILQMWPGGNTQVVVFLHGKITGLCTKNPAFIHYIG